MRKEKLFESNFKIVLKKKKYFVKDNFLYK